MRIYHMAASTLRKWHPQAVPKNCLGKAGGLFQWVRRVETARDWIARFVPWVRKSLWHISLGTSDLSFLMGVSFCQLGPPKFYLKMGKARGNSPKKADISSLVWTLDVRSDRHISKHSQGLNLNLSSDQSCLGTAFSLCPYGALKGWIPLSSEMGGPMVMTRLTGTFWDVTGSRPGQL